MTPLNLALHPRTRHLGADTSPEAMHRILHPRTLRLGEDAARRTESRWLARLGTALWSALQEARQSRPERELLELIERPGATRFARAAQPQWSRHPRA